jgi:hypothetical protein
MLNTDYQDVVRARVLGRLPFDRVEIATGGMVSRPSQSSQGASLLILASGYGRVLNRGERQTVLLDVDDEALIRIVGAQIEIAEATPKAPSRAAVSIPLRDRLNRVKAGFGFSSKEMAAVLRCSRAALYNWLDENHQGQVRDETLVRLAILEKLVVRWNAFGVGNLASHLHSAVVEHVDGQKSDLYSMLTQDALDEARVNEALSAIANLSRQQVTESRRVDGLVARGFGS